MRQRGNYRLLLNANVWPGINVAAMDGGKGVTFAIVNCTAAPGAEEGATPSPNKEAAAEGEEGSKDSQDSKLSTYAVRFKVRALWLPPMVLYSLPFRGSVHLGPPSATPHLSSVSPPKQRALLTPPPLPFSLNHPL